MSSGFSTLALAVFVQTNPQEMPSSLLQLREHLNLYLLNLNQTLPLVGQKVVELLIQMADLEFRLQVYLVIVL